MTAAPVPAHVAYLNRDVARFLTNHGFPVRDYQAVAGSPGEGHAATALPGEIRYSPSVTPALAVIGAYVRRGKRPRLMANEQDAVRLAIHEGLHQMRYGRTPEFYRGQDIGTPGGYEEGATEAIAQDLLPIYLRKRFGQRPDWPNVDYEDHVRNVRQLSTFGSGAGSFRDRAARVWRRSFLHADPRVRQQMVDQANAARAQWGQGSGR